MAYIMPVSTLMEIIGVVNKGLRPMVFSPIRATACWMIIDPAEARLN